ncbi:cytochrome P450 [Mycolicibacterium flavescens]|uniref:Cytochrome n=1 Tax=Mycolicibacterium flavescens TaxID=1776 RepID=A0A1E3RDE5_MYCFV|nr:cytochrome P450 [Mycolicibacterium flavescens]MCV7282373.1 cytochrome P450 [Mycolicibacterium flavescens]ODQ87898.1 cytochrome [Mycolicibacterium flavescens]
MPDDNAHTEQPYDFRLSDYARDIETLEHPQDHLAEKVATTRYERSADGAIYLYRHEDILKLNRHPAILGNGGRGSMVPGMPLVPLEIDGDDHVKWRKILDPLFAPKQVARLESTIRELTAELVDCFAHDTSVEMYSQFCVPLPCIAFLRLFGAPVDDLGFFLEYKNDMLRPECDTPEENVEKMQGAALRIAAYFIDILQKRREEKPGDDVLWALLQAEFDGEPLTDAQLLSIIMLMMFAGLDTVTASLSLMIHWLAQHPDERQRVIAEPTLMRGLVEELLRYESPVQTGTRYAAEGVDLGDGLVIEKGEAILASWGTANLDPNAHPNPLTVDIDRPRHQHIAFASGTHRCLGSNLARLELRVALEELHKRMPNYSLQPGEAIQWVNMPVRTIEYLPLVIGG